MPAGSDFRSSAVKSAICFLKSASEFVTADLTSWLKPAAFAPPVSSGYSALRSSLLALTDSLIRLSTICVPDEKEIVCSEAQKLCPSPPPGFFHSPSRDAPDWFGSSVHLPLNSPVCLPAESNSCIVKLPSAPILPRS